MNSEAQVRRRARILAVQALYSMEIGDDPARTAIRTAVRLSHDDASYEDPPELPYGEQLVDDVKRRQTEIDQLLGASGSRWRVDRMSPLDLQILRVAVAELLAKSEDLPAPVVIDEAVEVARDFGGGSSTGFVNGVLDAVARELGAIRGKSRGEEGKGG